MSLVVVGRKGRKKRPGNTSQLELFNFLNGLESGSFLTQHLSKEIFREYSSMLLSGK